MTLQELYRKLDYVNHSRERRAEMSALILDNPTLMAPLMEIAFRVDDPVSSRACWVMEFTVKRNLSYLYPYLDGFTKNLERVYLDSSVRPVAKICELLMESYFSEPQNETRRTMTDLHLEQIVSACFDWLIGEHKVAPQAYSMTSLLLLGRKFDWIRPELKMVLEQNYAAGSPAFQARARMTLAKIDRSTTAS
ncbi:adenylosuccinate lyase [Pricia sp. S334]|uniref:Adenylosuccinate lyase n=1 Tax=Pricia mediterranea TaxID=3076079 RepID=A0ABU3L971_9FLAO|nr:adenylosuccinate lyase [Pricia sp. S334]MDT7830291.1 adenylosuccinate lyase [Pricia sp. S334]